MSDDPLLAVDDLRVEFPTAEGVVTAVDGVSYAIEEGETFGFVGESGAGKTVSGLSLLRLIESPGEITNGSIRFRGTDLLDLDDAELRSIRGNEIAMIFQDPMTALNPTYTIGTQLIDTMTEHLSISKSAAKDRAIRLLEDVGIPDATDRIGDYPYQFSGGMRQRVLIAMAMSCEPQLIIADEPTTALDVTIQAQILDLLRDLQDAYDLSIQLITHDMGIIAEMCDRVAVMYAGRVVETGTVEEIFAQPRHPYTVGLTKAIPHLDDARQRLDTIEGSMPDLISTPTGCSFRDRCPHATDECSTVEPPLEPVTGGSDHRSACIRIDEIDFDRELEISPDEVVGPQRSIGEPILEVTDLQKYFTPESATWLERILGTAGEVRAVDGVDLTIREGETVGLVGESGCGKSTLGRTITQLYRPDRGTVLFAGTDLTDLDDSDLRKRRADFQFIFQDPFSSLNPRRTVKEIIGRPLVIHGKVSTDQEKEERVTELLERVGLAAGHLNRYPHEFSGGQKQRIGIARALAVEPDLIVADEPVSALDVSVQAKIINLLMDLQAEFDLTYLFIAHDLNVVQHIADKIAVMYLGEIIEFGDTADVFDAPSHPYTEILLSSIPQPTIADTTDRIVPEGQPPSPIDPPSGCRFHPRCPHRFEPCDSQVPEPIQTGDDHTISCHLFDEDLVEQDSGTSSHQPESEMPSTADR